MSMSLETSDPPPKFTHILTLADISNLISFLIISTLKPSYTLSLRKLPSEVVSVQALQTHPSLWETNDSRQDLIINGKEEGLPPGQLVVTGTVCLKHLGTCNLPSPASSWEREHQQAESAALVFLCTQEHWHSSNQIASYDFWSSEGNNEGEH